MRIPRVPRYGPGAQFYDILSLECPVYRVGRSRAIKLMGLKPGDRVLDIGCGTGLNFQLLRDKVGPQGHVVGVDASAAMLAQARNRARNWEVGLSISLPRAAWLIRGSASRAMAGLRVVGRGCRGGIVAPSRRAV